MAARLPSPLSAWRGIVKELRAIRGPTYRKSLAYNYIIGQFRKNESRESNGLELMLPSCLSVTGQRYCRADHEALHASHTYLCLLASTRKHIALHNLYHSKGESSVAEAAALVGLRLPTQPGGKGWEK